MIVTRKAFAAELGINVSRVAHYVRRGMPVVDGGVDRQVALDWVERNIIPQSGRNANKGASRVKQLRHRQVRAVEEELLDPSQERARRDRAATRRLELENELREGQLLPADEVRSAWTRIITLMRTNLLALPAKLASRLAGRPAPEVQEILMQEVRDILTALAAPMIWRRNPRQATKANGNGAGASEGKA